MVYGFAVRRLYKDYKGVWYWWLGSLEKNTIKGV